MTLQCPPVIGRVRRCANRESIPPERVLSAPETRSTVCPRPPQARFLPVSPVRRDAMAPARIDLGQTPRSRYPATICSATPARPRQTSPPCRGAAHADPCGTPFKRQHRPITECHHSPRAAQSRRVLAGEPDRAPLSLAPATALRRIKISAHPRHSSFGPTPPGPDDAPRIPRLPSVSSELEIPGHRATLSIRPGAQKRHGRTNYTEMTNIPVLDATIAARRSCLSHPSRCPRCHRAALSIRPGAQKRHGRTNYTEITNIPVLDATIADRRSCLSRPPRIAALGPLDARAVLGLLPAAAPRMSPRCAEAASSPPRLPDIVHGVCCLAKRCAMGETAWRTVPPRAQQTEASREPRGARTPCLALPGATGVANPRVELGLGARLPPDLRRQLFALEPRPNSSSSPTILSASFLSPNASALTSGRCASLEACATERPSRGQPPIPASENAPRDDALPGSPDPCERLRAVRG